MDLNLNINVVISADSQLLPLLEGLAKKYQIEDKIKITPKEALAQIVDKEVVLNLPAEEPEAETTEQLTIAEAAMESDPDDFEAGPEPKRDFAYLSARAKTFIAHKKPFTIYELLNGGEFLDKNEQNKIYQFLRGDNTLHVQMEDERREGARRRLKVYVPTWKDKAGTTKYAKVPSAAI